MIKMMKLLNQDYYDKDDDRPRFEVTHPTRKLDVGIVRIASPNNRDAVKKYCRENNINCEILTPYFHIPIADLTSTLMQSLMVE